MGKPMWGKGNDIARLEPNQIHQAQTYGCTVARWLSEGGYSFVYLPADAITIQVANSHRKEDTLEDDSNKNEVVLPHDSNSAEDLPVSIMVRGNKPWTPTGLFLRAGDEVAISAAGSVSMGSGWPPMPPSGRPPNCDEAARTARTHGITRNYPALELPCWSLIGRIGDTGTAFYVGERKTFRVANSGQLWLGVNDDDLGDNSGEWTVEIKRQPRISGWR